MRPVSRLRSRRARRVGAASGKGAEGREAVGYLLYAAPYLARGLERDLDTASPDHAPLVLLEYGGPLGGGTASYMMRGVLPAQVGVGVRIAFEDALRRQGDAEVGAGLGLDLEPAGLESGDGAVQVEEDGFQHKQVTLVSAAISSNGLTQFPCATPGPSGYRPRVEYWETGLSLESQWYCESHIRVWKWVRVPPLPYDLWQRPGMGTRPRLLGGRLCAGTTVWRVRFIFKQ